MQFSCAYICVHSVKYTYTCTLQSIMYINERQISLYNVRTCEYNHFRHPLTLLSREKKLCMKA